MAMAKGLNDLPSHVIGLTSVVFFVLLVLLCYIARKKQNKDLG